MHTHPSPHTNIYTLLTYFLTHSLMWDGHVSTRRGNTKHSHRCRWKNLRNYRAVTVDLWRLHVINEHASWSWSWLARQPYSLADKDLALSTVMVARSKVFWAVQHLTSTVTSFPRCKPCTSERDSDVEESITPLLLFASVWCLKRFMC